MIEVGCIGGVGRGLSLVGFEVYLFVCVCGANYPRPPNLRSSVRGPLRLPLRQIKTPHL